jgi:plasmid stability protein
MKTTLDLPDELMRTIKMRAAQEDRKLKDLNAELLRKGLAVIEERPKATGNRVKLPLITGGHPAAPGEEITPERVKEILLEEDIRKFLGD